MRKSLLTTSALVGAAVLASPLLTTAPAAAQDVEVSMSGSIRYYLRNIDSDASTPGPGWEINDHAPATELRWDVNATADNGLQYGGRIDFRPTTGGTDEAWLDFQGGWGTVVIGDDDGVVDSKQVAGTSVMPIGAWDTGRFTGGFLAPAGFVNGNSAPGVFGESGDSSSISYYSPSFAGFSVGLTATPDTSSSFGNGSNDATAGQTNTIVHNQYEIAVAYANEFDGFGIDLSAGYVGGTTEANGGLNQGRTAGNDFEDVGAFQLGANVSVAGFGVGVGYWDNDDSGCASGTTGCDAGMGFDAGLSYNFGAGAIGVGYAYGETDWDGTNGEDEETVYSIEADYDLATGLNVFGGVAFAEREDDAGGANSSVDSTVFVLGTTLSF